MKRRRPLFTLMLAAFVMVIMLSLCGMATAFIIATRVPQGGSSQDFGPPWTTNQRNSSATPVPVLSGTPVTIHTYPNSGFRGPIDWRGPVSALLVFAAVLLGAATFFS